MSAHRIVALALALLLLPACASEGARLLVDWEARRAAHDAATFDRAPLRLSREVTPGDWGRAIEAVDVLRQDARTRSVLQGLLGERADGGPPVPLVSELAQPYKELAELLRTACQAPSGRSPFAWGDARLTADPEAAGAVVAAQLGYIGARSRLQKALKLGATDSGALDGVAASILLSRDLARGASAATAGRAAELTVQLTDDLQRTLAQVGWSAPGLGRLIEHLLVLHAHAPGIDGVTRAETLAREAAFVAAHGGTAPPGSAPKAEGDVSPAAWKAARDAVAADAALAEVTARLTCAQQSLAAAIVVATVRRHATVHGTLPKTLEGQTTSRGAALPVDPVTGKAFGYRVEDKGGVLVRGACTAGPGAAATGTSELRFRGL